MTILSFRGQFSHTIDKKGRTSIPVRFREILKARYDDHLVLSPRNGYLRVYPLEEWERMEESLKRFSKFNRAVDDFKRFLFSAAHDCTVDGQGRILIHPELRRRAGLRDKVLFVGMMEWFEIWDREAFEQRYTPTGETMEALEDKLAELEEKLGT